MKKRRIVWCLLALVLAAVVAVVLYLLFRYRLNREYEKFLPEAYVVEKGGAFTALEGEAHVPGFSLAAKNDALELYAREDTGEIALYDLRNGVTVYSNPPEADSDPLANQSNKNYMKSQFLLDYFNASKTSGIYDSWSWCTQRGQMRAEGIEDGIRFVYDVGNKTSIDYYVPAYLSAEIYRGYLDTLTAEAEDLEAQSQEKYEAGDEDEGKRLHRESLTVTANANFIEAQYNKGAVNADGMVELIPATAQIKDPPQPKGNRAKLFSILEPLGMNEELYWEQMELAGFEAAEDMGFVIALEYRLKEDGLEVSVPVSLMEESGGGKISMISLLPYLGAAGTKESGYLVLPNGSGSLMYFNNGKQDSAAIYNQYIYDIDLADADYTQLQNTTSARLAIFGICREESGILATIEKGAAFAHLTADVSGRSGSYNYCYPIFKLRGDTSMEMFGSVGTGGNEMHLIEDDLYDENVTVRYTLLTDEYEGYAGLANYYRERLIAEGKLTPKEEAGDLPFYYDVICGVKETAHFLGVQYLRVLPMTTFAEAQKMAEAFREKGIVNQLMNLQGWMNGGYYHDVADKIKVIAALGGKSGLKELSGALERMGGGLYLDAAFQKVTDISRRYIAAFEGARYSGAGYLVELGLVNPTTLRRTSGLGYRENFYTLLSPRFLHRYVQAFAGKAEDIPAEGIALRDLGWELHADKRRKAIVSREQALDIVKTQLDVLKDTGKAILYEDANDYAFATADHIVNAPLSATSYFLLDETIPLYEMILHGCVDYAGSAINAADADDRQTERLKMVEYGASCHYVFTWEESSKMKYTALNVFGSTTFSTWEEQAADTYAYVNEALAPVSASFMVGHETLAEGVKKVSYDNGAVLYINYNDKAVQAEGNRIPAKSYVRKGGEEE